jgi:NAD(P)-dependent dehydrogenase (short-subunit alcohol dehydrogenase family)
MGVVHAVRAVLPSMIARRSGHLVSVASTLSLMGGRARRAAGGCLKTAFKFRTAIACSCGAGQLVQSGAAARAVSAALPRPLWRPRAPARRRLA